MGIWIIRNFLNFITSNINECLFLFFHDLNKRAYRNYKQNPSSWRLCWYYFLLQSTKMVPPRSTAHPSNWKSMFNDMKKVFDR